MGNINLGRVLLGGLLAGVILNIGEFVFNDFVLGSQMKEYLARHNFTEPGGSFVAVAVGLTFVLGIVMVLGYAAIRPRFGAGAKTAVIAALFAWFGVYLYTGLINGLLFNVPMNLLLLAFVWGLVEYILAAIAGAWLYKEA